MDSKVNANDLKWIIDFKTQIEEIAKRMLEWKTKIYSAVQRDEFLEYKAE